jgi:hypothetical protein
MFFFCSEMLGWLRGAWRKIRGTGAAGWSAQLAARVEEHGWTAIYVGDYATAPTWTYTIGFDETLGQPEVIVFDIPQDAANALLWEVFTQIKDGRLVLEDGKVWPEGEEHPCVWRKVHPTQLEGGEGWFTLANMRSLARNRTPFGFEAFQLVLSDNEGRLPWQDGYDERLRPLQPALYMPREPEAPLAAEATV